MHPIRKFGETVDYFMNEGFMWLVVFMIIFGSLYFFFQEEQYESDIEVKMEVSPNERLYMVFEDGGNDTNSTTDISLYDHSGAQK